MKKLTLALSVLILGSSLAIADSKAAGTYQVVEDCTTKEKVSVKEAYFVYDSKKAPNMVVAFKSQKDANEFALKNGGKVQQLDLIKDKIVVSCDDNVTKIK